MNAVEERQADVEHGCVGQPARGFDERDNAIVDNMNLMALSFEQQRQSIRYIAVVFG